MRIYVGSFTSEGHQAGRSLGVAALAFDDRSGMLTHEATLPLPPDPSWLTPSPRDRTLYAAMHTSRFEGQSGGAIVALAVDPTNGALRRSGHIVLPFPHPNHLAASADGRFLVAASGLGGGLTVVALAADGAPREPTFAQQQEGSAIIPFGRVAPIPATFPPGSAYPHCILLDDTAGRVLAADLMRDTVDSYTLDSARGLLLEHRVTRLRAGSGPRMLAFHPRLPILYLLNQNDSTLSVLDYERSSGILTERAASPTTADRRTRSNAPAALAVHPSGDLLFVSNRGDDTIAVFVLDPTGMPALRETVPSDPEARRSSAGSGANPRHLALTTNGDWLFVANTTADNVTVFRVDAVGGALEPASSVALATPTCVALMPS